MPWCAVCLYQYSLIWSLAGHNFLKLFDGNAKDMPTPRTLSLPILLPAKLNFLRLLLCFKPALMAAYAEDDIFCTWSKHTRYHAEAKQKA